MAGTATAAAAAPPPQKNPNAYSVRWFQGMAGAAVFSLAYILTPLYMLSIPIAFLVLPLYTAVVYTLPMLISAIIPCQHAPGLVKQLQPIADSYFQYDQVAELSDDDIRDLLKEGKKFILAFQPHGVISFTGMCAAIKAPDDLRPLKTAVASSLMKTPILKHVMGVFGFVDASKSSLKKHFKNPGLNGSVAIYVGGIAELFKSSLTEERLFLSKRKGFIKLALTQGVDVVPAYLFGNTSILSVMTSGPLANLSRSTGVALTYFWGKWLLPIPRDDALLYARGKPLGMPHIAEPTQEDIDKWHGKYCKEVERLFNTYKERVPQYKHKKLYID